ncbi:MAG: TolC family protein [Candidatus Omnitrophota bacterium]|jgi:outer membrane protein TolC|nr:MAG: TolC family protein [Candidatus Omnitrophota bacterium]
MLKKLLIIILLSIFILNHPVFAQGILSLGPLIEEARENNPGILAAKKRWEAALARVPQAKSLQDPTIGIAFEKIPRGTLKLNKVMADDRMLSLQQFFPFFGKLTLKGKIAMVESQMFAAEYKNKELEIINLLKNAYYDLFMKQKEIELSRQSLRLLQNIANVAEAGYTVGGIPQEEVYKINSEIARLSTNIKNLDQEKSAKQTLINSLLNRDPEMPLGDPDLKEDVLFDKDVRALYQATLLNQPELVIFSYSIEKNKYSKSLAKRSFFPDFMASIVQRGITSGMLGPWDLMLAFNVPLWFWTKQRYEIKEAIANLEEAEAAYKAMQNKAFSEVKDLAAKIEVSKNKITLNKTSLIPMLEASIESSLAAFNSGKGDFMMLLDSQRMLIETKMDYYRALVEYNMNLADLERTVGIQLQEEK